MTIEFAADRYPMSSYDRRSKKTHVLFLRKSSAAGTL
jgi:hypothetical protein